LDKIAISGWALDNRLLFLSLSTEQYLCHGLFPALPGKRQAGFKSDAGPLNRLLGIKNLILLAGQKNKVSAMKGLFGV
jgi:hypothetical protein